MSLAGRLEAARKTPTKSLDRIISELDKEDADALNAAATYPAFGPDDDVTAELDRWTDTRPLTIVVDKA